MLLKSGVWGRVTSRTPRCEHKLQRGEFRALNFPYADQNLLIQTKLVEK